MVGSVNCALTDHNRTAHLGCDAAGRVIIVKVWYPVDASKPPATAREKLWQDMRDDPATPVMMKLLLRRTARIETNSHIQPDISTQAGKAPILLYNHGMISFTAENTFLMEDLASHGFIVIALQHAAQMMELRALQGRQPKPERQRQAQIQKQILGAAGRERADLSRQYYHSASNTNQIVAARSLDTRYVLDQITEILLAVPGIQATGPGTDSIGMVGYSVGGSVATEFAKADRRAACVVNMDGGIYGTRPDQAVSVPYCMLYSQANDGCNATSLILEDTSLLVCKTFDDTTHMNFHEISMVFPALRWLGVIGKVNPVELLIARNQYIINFVKTRLM